MFLASTLHMVTKWKVEFPTCNSDMSEQLEGDGSRAIFTLTSSIMSSVIYYITSPLVHALYMFGTAHDDTMSCMYTQ